MVGAAAGLALRGRIPVVHALATFLTLRAFEFIRTDVGIAGLPVKLVGDVPGFLSEANGPTHQAIEDVALMRGIPGMQVVCPADEEELVGGAARGPAQPARPPTCATWPARPGSPTASPSSSAGPSSWRDGRRRDPADLRLPGGRGARPPPSCWRSEGIAGPGARTCARWCRSTRRRCCGAARETPAAGHHRGPLRSPAACSRIVAELLVRARRAARRCVPIRAGGALVPAGAAGRRAARSRASPRATLAARVAGPWRAAPAADDA